MTLSQSTRRVSFSRHWFVAVALVFTAQLAAIFWLGTREPIRVRAARVTPPMLLPSWATLDLKNAVSGLPVPTDSPAAAAAKELLALTDPTLFALPHAESFSGPAWLQAQPPEQKHFNWSEEPRWLQPDAATLATLASVAGKDLVIPPPPALPPADLAPAEIKLDSILNRESALQVEGSLGSRKLENHFDLPAWHSADVLSNSVVQVVVNPAGRPVSAVLVTGCGFAPADQHAVSQALAARFEPLPNASQGAATPLAFGNLVFVWATLAPTNSPAP